MYDDVLQRNAAGELEMRTVNSTGDTGTNKDDVFTRDSQGRLCVRTTGTGGGGGGASTAAEVSFDPAGTNYIQSDNVQGALVELDAELKNANDEIDKKVDTAQGADNSGKLLGVGSDGNVALVDNPVPAGGTAGQVLTKTADGTEWKDVGGGSALPDQTGNEGKFLQTDGTTVSWANALVNNQNTVGGGATGLGIGDGSNAYGQSVAIGFTANSGWYSCAIGYGAKTAEGSIAIGNGCVVNDSGCFDVKLGNLFKAKQYRILNADGIIPVERLPQTNYGLKISDTFTQAVNNAATYNLFTTVDLATDVSLEANMPKSNYSIADGALKLPTNAGYVDYGIEVRLNGAFAGGENTNREFTIQLQRADGTVISEKAVIKLTGNDLSKRSVVFETYTNTATDPFIAGGFKLVINNTSGQTLNLTGCDILIKARA